MYKNEELRSRSWVPRKKYYIAKIQESKSTEFSFKEEQDTSLGVFVPRLPVSIALYIHTHNLQLAVFVYFENHCKHFYVAEVKAICVEGIAH